MLMHDLRKQIQNIYGAIMVVTVKNISQKTHNTILYTNYTSW